MLKAALDTIGYFWLPSAPKRQVAGRLLFDAKQQRLDLLGSLEGGALIGAIINDASGSEVLIQGQTLKGRFTLVGCQHRNTIAFGLVSTSYYVSSVLAGIHRVRPKSRIRLGFNSMDMSLNSLGNWVGVVSTDMTMKFNEDTGYSKIEMTYQPVLEECKFRWGKVALRVDYTMHLFGNKQVTPNYFIRITFNKMRSLADLRRLRSAIQTLLTIGTNSPVLIENAQIKFGSRSSTWYDHSRGDDLGEVHVNDPHRYLFTYSSLGGIKSVAKWLDMYLRYEQPINSLVSHHYIASMYSENRYINLMVALEGIADQQNAKSTRFGERVKYVAKMIYDRLGNTLFREEKSALQWAKVAADIRNKWAAHGGNRDVDYTRMDIFANSIYYLVMLWFLTECKMPKSAIGSIQENWDFRNIKEQIENYL